MEKALESLELPVIVCVLSDTIITVNTGQNEGTWEVFVRSEMEKRMSRMRGGLRVCVLCFTHRQICTRACITYKIARRTRLHDLLMNFYGLNFNMYTHKYI